jgi:hypothetical protein
LKSQGGEAERHVTISSGSMKALLKIDCQGTATDPESRGGDSRLGQVQMVVTGHKAKNPRRVGSLERDKPSSLKTKP